VIKLDRYDLAILRILERDGRITKSRLAEAVNLSISPAWERVRKLEESGVIRGYRADVDWVGTFSGSRIVVEVTLSRHTAPTCGASRRA
jgi:Lrp/AsnC family transcriptional regulator of ectoine degradation